MNAVCKVQPQKFAEHEGSSGHPLQYLPGIERHLSHPSKSEVTSVDSMLTGYLKPELVLFSTSLGQVGIVAGNYPHRFINVAKHEGRVNAVAASPSGTKIASVGSDRMMIVSSLLKNQPPLVSHPHSKCIRSIRWSSNSSLLITSSDDKLAKIWLMSRNSVHFKGTLSGHTNWVRFAAFDSQQTTMQAVTCSDDCSVKLWDVERKKNVLSFTGHSRAVVESHFLPQSPYCVNGIASGSEDNSVNVWDLREPNPVQHYGSHGGAVKSLALYPCGLNLLSACTDGILRMWDLRAGRLHWMIKAHSGSINCVRISRMGERTYVYTGGEDRMVHVWRIP